MQREKTALDRSWNASKDWRLALSTVPEGCEFRVRLQERQGGFLLATHTSTAACYWMTAGIGAGLVDHGKERVLERMVRLSFQIVRLASLHVMHLLIDNHSERSSAMSTSSQSLNFRMDALLGSEMTVLRTLYLSHDLVNRLKKILLGLMPLTILRYCWSANFGGSRDDQMFFIFMQFSVKITQKIGWYPIL